jgi:hypothetical protein
MNYRKNIYKKQTNKKTGGLKEKQKNSIPHSIRN